ncbi:hypothetical protein PCL_11518 [Purpureocillium lilacinum]|uniref:Uncharacterized protein n=1 Tax=Purpureocillium lilacinum TaxID=33203 RepID=A0A2U3EA97_PURLI|nr:hypothetical protein Purlil1_2773 [Purpureocillium lilacinum]PWI71424.1 hypothetical protein PCL_11518 [Purpureocillium lilacinum]
MSCLRDGGFAAQRNVDCTSSAKRDGYTLFGTGAFNFMREFGDVQLLKTSAIRYMYEDKRPSWLQKPDPHHIASYESAVRFFNGTKPFTEKWNDSKRFNGSERVQNGTGRRGDATPQRTSHVVPAWALSIEASHAGTRPLWSCTAWCCEPLTRSGRCRRGTMTNALAAVPEDGRQASGVRARRDAGAYA